MMHGQNNIKLHYYVSIVSYGLWSVVYFQ